MDFTGMLINTYTKIIVWSFVCGYGVTVVLVYNLHREIHITLLLTALLFFNAVNNLY